MFGLSIKSQSTEGITDMKASLARALLAVSIALALSAPNLFGQTTTGTPGSPGATTTINGKQLPPPDPKFGGVNKVTIKIERPQLSPADLKRLEEESWQNNKASE
jgi:hypothetical protein